MKNIDSDLIRGNIDTIILKTMLNEDKYGLDIIKEVEQRSNGTYELKQPTLYSCLKRLENQELISSYWLNSDIGGRRHYYKLTEKGREFYNKKQEEWAKSKFVIDNLLSNYNYEEYRLVKKDDYDKALSAASSIDDETPLANEPNNNDTNLEEIPIQENLAETEEDSESDKYEDLSESLEEENSEESLDYDNEEESPEEQSDEDFDDSPLEDDEESEEPSDEVVYVSSTHDSSKFEDEAIEETSASYELEDQTQNESNILNMLRKQSNEEINTYEGDKKSYANQIKSIYDDVKYVQDDMIFANDSEDDDEVDQKIQEFEDAAKELNDFESDSFDEESESQDEPEVDMPEYEEQSESEEFEDIEDSTEDFESESNYDESEDFDEEESFEYNEAEEFNFGYQDDDATSEEEFDEKFNIDEDESRDEFDFSASDDDQTEEYDNPENYNSYEAENSSFFSANDTTDYDDYQSNDSDKQNFDDYSSYEEPIQTYSLNEINDFDFSPASFDSYSNKFNKDEYDSTFVNVKKEAPAEDSYDFESDASVAKSDIDSIISKNAYDFESSKPQNNDFFERRYVTENYKQKLSNLSVYSKASQDSQKDNEVQSEPTQADDMETLKLNFEREGIKIKEYKKITSFEEPEKTYLLANKINLFKSLILLFGYIFVLSAMYIILQNSAFGAMTEGFDIKYFLFGMIPFAIFAIYHLAIYLINPYKKVPARYASRIMMFIAVILTVQLLLITYCVNLQLGFYSFTQAGYNHLLWVIPSIISFGPIISNLIYMALFHSGNFNV